MAPAGNPIQDREGTLSREVSQALDDFLAALANELEAQALGRGLNCIAKLALQTLQVDDGWWRGHRVESPEAGASLCLRSDAGQALLIQLDASGQPWIAQLFTAEGGLLLRLSRLAGRTCLRLESPQGGREIDLGDIEVGWTDQPRLPGSVLPSPTKRAQFCTQCGQQLHSADSRFCHRCGHPVENERNSS